MVTTDSNEAMTDGNASFLRAARSGNVEKIIEHLKGNIDINTSNANGLNALHLASKEGNVNVVTELLKRGANVNAATKKGNTALHIASLAGQEEVVKVLVQLGANVNVQSQNGFTPLYMAAQENHDSVVSFLLANGANQSLATEDGFTPLAVALQQGHDKVVAVLLENDTKGRVRLPALHIAAKKDDCKAATLLLQSDHNPDVTSKSGFTPLHIAAHYGNENIAKILLSKGADVNYAAKHQITPLHVASKWGKMNMVVLLLENGANIEAATRDGLTPLHCAARSGHDQVVDLLLEKGAPFLAKTKNGLAPLHMASQGDHVDSARILLYHKAPVDDVTVDYLTALHVAAHCGHVKVAKLLLDRKADPNARALNGFTPLHIACKKNRIKVVELLLKHGASIEATTESGLTPLHVASFMGCMNIVIYLIQNGANPDVPTVRGETPLHLAARANQTDIIRILLRNGASVDARAREEQTPLHIAARLGNVDIVSLLLQHGAAVDATTKDMYTALHIAAKEDQEEVASSLLDHGASLTSTTKKGFTPLHLAAKYGNIKVARLLIQKEAPVDAQGKNGVTPLHVAAHYDHVNVALLLLDKGASPHAMAKNGYTPLHIAAKKNQMDIASTLLEYGAKTNSESKAGFTPLHLSSQEGHADMSSLLIENKADVNHKANNGLTPLHLCAQDDRVNVAHILVAHKAEIGPQTKAGYTPLHVASHFGQINMVRFLLQNRANVQTTTSHGYTPLHQAAQQGHTLVVNLLLENQASPNVTTTQGQTPLSIAQRLGYISVVETLKVVTETTVTTTTTTVTEEKYKVVAPETMQETFMTDSEDEGGADFDEAAIFGKPTHATHVYLPYLEGQNFQMSEEAMLGDQSYGYLTADEMKSLGDDSLPIDVTKDEKHHDIMHSVKQFGAPMVEEDKLSPQHVTPVESGFSEKFSPDNIDLARVPVHAGFLVSFMVDARGGAMRGCRHSGVRIIIPPRKASMPMRITCRYLRKEKLIHPPPLMEGEACASRILEMGPVGARFLGPVIIEVPHFASTRGKEREITILRSDTGESWREHVLEASEEAVQEVLNESFEGEELNALEDLNTNRITRILTTDFPQYFAIITRVRQEVHGVGPEGGMVSSTVVPQVQAIFPEGALTKKIRVGLQAQPIAPELVAKLLGNRVAVSPIVTVEPRRRKFHKPITLTIPVPQAATKGMINQYSGDAPTLRLLCSITGGSSKAQWEDVTGSTPLTFVNDCVSFTTTVSARFWLMDCRQVNEVTRFATELYQEAVYVPFMSKFVIFAKRYDPYEAQLRVFCMTDDKEDKTLECQENFTEIAKSRDVEVLEGKLQYLEFAGNIAPVTKSGEQLKFPFQAFHENRLPFTIRVKDPHIEPMGRIAFMREPKAGRGEPPQIPICNLNVALPDIIHTDSSADVIELVTLEKRYDFIQEAGLSKPELIHRADLRLSDIAQGLDKDWVLLAQQLDMSENDIAQIKADSTSDQSEQALMMLRLWLQKSGSKATGNELEKGLRKINREDIIKNCMFNVELVTDDVEKAVAKVHLDQSGFDVFKEELGSSREASMRRGASLDISYDEQDIMKEAESAAETSSETGSLFERDQISQALTDDKELICQKDESSKCNIEDVSALFPKCKKTSVQQNEETAFPNSNIHTSDVINNSQMNQTSSFNITESNNKTGINKEEHVIVPISQDLRKLHEFWPPDKIILNQSNSVHTKPTEPISSSHPSESKTSINNQQSVSKDKDIDNILHETLVNNITKEKIMNISNATVTENGAKGPLNDNILLSKEADKSVDVNDLGYCSMDKDSSTSPTFSDSTKLVSLNLASKDASLESKIESPVITPSQEQNILADTLLLLEQKSNLQLLEDKNMSQIEPAIVSSENPVKDIKSNSNVIVATSESIKVASVASNSGSDIICTPVVECVTTSTVISVEHDNSKPENSKVEDARIRRASKTPPPSPVDEAGRDFENADKVKEILLSQSVLHDKFKDDNLKGPAEVEQKLVETSGRQEIPARLTESETWPSLELDTSQVSISSLPEDEKSEPTTATVSDAVALAADTDENVEATEEKDVPRVIQTTQVIQTTTVMTVQTPEVQSIEEVPEIKDLKDALQDTIIEGEKHLPSEVEQLSSRKMTEITTVTKVVSETTTAESLPKELEQITVEVQSGIESLPEGFSLSEPEQVTQDVVQQEMQLERKTDVTIGKEHAQQSFEESVLTEDEVDHELESDANIASGLAPCAFVNTAFAGAELIDKVEQAAPIRARSPYEVIRGDQSESIEQVVHPVEEPKDLSSTITRTTYVTKHTEMRHRPMLQNIPSEISEEDLVEREIGSPALSLEAFGFPGHPETHTEENVTTETTTSDSGTVTKTTVITRVTTRTSVLHDELSDEDEGSLEKYSQLQATEGDVSEGIVKEKERDTLESVNVDQHSGTSILETLPKREDEDMRQDSIITTTITKTVTERTISANGKMEEPQDSLPSPAKPQADEVIESYEAFEGTQAKQILNGPGEVDYHQEYDYSDEYPQNKWSTEQYGYADPSCSDSPFKEPLASNEMRKSRYSSLSDDVIDYEIGEILKSEHQFEDIIERPMTPEPPVDEYSDPRIISKPEVAGSTSEYELKEKDDSLFEEGEPISSPALSPDDSRSGFAYGMQFEKDVLDVAEEAMDIDSDPYSEEKEPAYAYGMRYERDAGLEDEDVPCYGDLYTHEEEDEDALENGDKVKVALKPKKEPDYDILAGRKYFSKNVEIDELSVSSLQEFEHLEAEIVSGRKSSIGSLDSLNDKPPNSKSGDHDDVSMSSLTEFERLERECLEVEKIDPAMQESITQLSEIEEGHESQASETSQENKSDGCKDEELSIIEEYDHHLGDIDNIILKVESESKDELPFQYLLKQVPKPSDAFKGEISNEGDKTAEVVRKSDSKTEYASCTFTSESCMLISQQSQEHLTKSNGRSDDIDQDSLRDEISLKPDSLAEDPRHEYLDSLHEGKCDDDDSLQGDIPDEMRDSLLEERHLEDDSLHDMDILPDESSLSMESSFAAAISHESSKADDHIKGKKADSVAVPTTLESSFITTLKDEKVEIIVSELPKHDIMLSSTDSLEQSSSAAAAFHFESESAMSTSLTGALASEDNTMISSTDTLEHEGRITFRYEDIPVDDLEILVKDGRKVIVDSEGNIQTEYDMKHFLESEDNLNDFNLSSKTFTEIKLPSTSTVQVQSAVTSISYTGEPDDLRTKIHQSITDGTEKESKFESTYSDPDVEVEEIHTTDEYGNPKVIKKVKKVITTKTQFSSSSSSENVEEKLKEFLREHAAGDKAGLGEEVVQEERSIDDKGNVLLVRTVQQQILSEPEVHSRTFTGPDAATLSEEYVKRFKDSDPTDDICEYEKIDDEGNVVRVTQQVVIKPEVHSVSFSGPNAREQMEEYMRRFTPMSQNGDARESSQSFSTVQVTTTTTEQDPEGVPSESGSLGMSGIECIQTTTSSSTPESSGQIVRTTTTTCTSFSSTDDTAQPGETTHHASSS